MDESQVNWTRHFGDPALGDLWRRIVDLDNDRAVQSGPVLEDRVCFGPRVTAVFVMFMQAQDCELCKSFDSQSGRVPELQKLIYSRCASCTGQLSSK